MECAHEDMLHDTPAGYGTGVEEVILEERSPTPGSWLVIFNFGDRRTVKEENLTLERPVPEQQRERPPVETERPMSSDETADSHVFRAGAAAWLHNLLQASHLNGEERGK